MCYPRLFAWIHVHMFFFLFPKCRTGYTPTPSVHMGLSLPIIAQVPVPVLQKFGEDRGQVNFIVHCYVLDNGIKAQLQAKKSAPLWARPVPAAIAPLWCSDGMFLMSLRPIGNNSLH